MVAFIKFLLCCCISPQPNSHVTVLSESLSPSTTSDVAAGVFGPSNGFRVNNSCEATERCLREAVRFYEGIRRDHPVKEHGVCQVRCFITSCFVV